MNETKTNLQYTKKHVSAAALKFIHEKGLDSLDGEKYLENQAKVFTDESDLTKLCTLLFAVPPKAEDVMENVDLAEVRNALNFFNENGFGIKRG
jgi:hypothetical protein